MGLSTENPKVGLVRRSDSKNCPYSWRQIRKNALEWKEVYFSCRKGIEPEFGQTGLKQQRA